jgi:dCTP deaminase
MYISPYSSTALDLTLDKRIKTFRPPVAGKVLVFDPSADGFSVKSLLEDVTEERDIDKVSFTLGPSTLILGWTAEALDLDLRAKLAARVEGKSSLARLGLAVHVTAPTIHAGFRGQIQLEIINFGNTAIKLSSGMKVCQLIFEQTLGTPDAAYSGQFSGQGPAK